MICFKLDLARFSLSRWRRLRSRLRLILNFRRSGDCRRRRRSRRRRLIALVGGDRFWREEIRPNEEDRSRKDKE